MQHMIILAQPIDIGHFPLFILGAGQPQELQFPSQHIVIDENLLHDKAVQIGFNPLGVEVQEHEISIFLLGKVGKIDISLKLHENEPIPFEIPA